MNSDNEEAKEEKHRTKRQTKKESKRAPKKSIEAQKETKDYAHFLQDLEEDKELRQHVNLYRDDAVLEGLEAKMNDLTLDPTKKIKKAVRKTEEGKKMQEISEAQRIKEAKLLKANLKQKEEIDSDDWESCEEDAPVVQLQELLANMHVGGGDDDESD